MLVANILLAFILTPLVASQLSDLVLRDDSIADVDLSDQIPKDPGNLTFAFDELLGEFDLFKRQRRCNPGWAPCPSGGCCRIGDTCTPTGCCRGNQQACGARNCYNPSTQICCPGGGGACPKGYDCMKDKTCCPAGELPCGPDKCFNPKTSKCCQRNGQIWGCKHSAECCGVGQCYLPGLQQCCPDGPRKRAEGDACEPPATKTGTATITAAPEPTAFPPPKQPQTTTQTIQFVYDGGRKVTVKKGKNKGKQYPAPPKGVMENMCRGIQELTGSAGQKATLTKASNSQRRRNRRKMCPTGWCADAVKEYIARFYPNGIPKEAEQAIMVASNMQCDEFPFARSHEGGNIDRGKRICVPASDNGWQGTAMSPFFRGKNKIKENEKFVIEMVGWDCKNQRPISPTRRDLDSLNAVSGSDAYRNVYPENPDLKALIMPLGDLAAGSYSINLTIASGNVNASLHSYDGETFDTTQGSNGELLFSLPDDEFGVSLVGTTMDDDAEVLYEAKKVSSTNTTSSPSGTVGVVPTVTVNMVGKSGQLGRITLGALLVSLMALYLL